MNEQKDRPIETLQELSFEFGGLKQEGFESPAEPSPNMSINVQFESVRRFMSDKPLRRPVRTRPAACYRRRVYLIPEDDGGFSAVAADLPGVASQSDTEQEAIRNITEAYEGAIQSYKDNGFAIPWVDRPQPAESGWVTRWVIVHG